MSKLQWPVKVCRNDCSVKKEVNTGAQISILSSRSLWTCHGILESAESHSTTRNVKRTRKALQNFANLHNATDSTTFDKESSVPILSLLSSYCILGTNDALDNDSTGDLLQGLKRVLEEVGYYQNWTVDNETERGNVNLLKESQILVLSVVRIEFIYLHMLELPYRLVYSLLTKYYFMQKQFGLEFLQLIGNRNR